MGQFHSHYTVIDRSFQCHGIEAGIVSRDAPYFCAASQEDLFILIPSLISSTKNVSEQFCVFRMGLNELPKGRDETAWCSLGETPKSAGHKENWNPNYSIGYESILTTWTMQTMRSNGVSLLTYSFKCTTLGAVQPGLRMKCAVSGVFLH